MRKLEADEKLVHIAEWDISHFDVMSFAEFKSIIGRIYGLIDNRECIVTFSNGYETECVKSICFKAIEKLNEEELEQKRKSEESLERQEEIADWELFEQLKRKYGW